MLEAVRDFYLDTGIEIAMKPARGIRNLREIYADEDAYKAHPLPLHFLEYETATKGMVQSRELINFFSSVPQRPL